MVQAAVDDPIADDGGGRFLAVFRFELPNQAAVRAIQCVGVAISGREIDAVTFDRWLARPGRAAPGIFDETGRWSNWF